MLSCLVLGCGGADKADKTQTDNAATPKDSQWQRGVEMFFEGRPPEDYYEPLAALDKQSPQFAEPYFHFVLGYAEWGWNNYPVAIPHFLKELEHWDGRYQRPMPTHVEVLGFTADAHYKTGLLFKEFFNTALNVELNYYNFLFILNERRATQKIDNEKLTLLPYREDYLHFFRGLCYFHLNFLADARKDWEKIESGSELYGRGQSMLGLIAYKEGKVEEAKKIWDGLSTKKDAQLDLGIAQVLTRTEPWRAQGLAALAQIYKEGKAQPRVAVYYAGEVARDPNRLEESEKILHSLAFNEPELRNQWGRLVPDKGQPIEYYVDFYDPYGLNILAEYHLQAARKYYQLYAQEAKKPAAEAYQAVIGLSLGELVDSQAILQTLQRAPDADPTLRLAVLLGLRTVAAQLHQEQELMDLDGSIRQIAEGNPAYRSYLGRFTAEMGEDPKRAVDLCSGPEVFKPGPYSQHMAYALFVKGAKERDMATLTKSIELYEKNHIAESIYSVRKNDPVVLQGLANAFFVRRWFDFGPKIYLKFRDLYPEAEQIFDSLRHATQLWEALKWDQSGEVDIVWHELSQQKTTGYSQTLKEMIDSCQ